MAAWPPDCPPQMTRRAMRLRRHRERRASQARITRNPRSYPGAGYHHARATRNSRSRLARVPVEPTDTPAKGVFLISHPLAGLHAPGDVFHRSVVLLVEHDAGRAYGLVVNKDTGQTLEEALCSDGASSLASDALRRVLGNPVRSGGRDMSRLAWLHHHAEVGGMRLSEEAERPVRQSATFCTAVYLCGATCVELASPVCFIFVLFLFCPCYYC